LELRVQLEKREHLECRDIQGSLDQKVFQVYLIFFKNISKY